jgi:NAD+ kinase
MRVSLFGKNSDSIRHFIPEYGLELVEDQPEVIISYGGDGTLLSAERKYPSIPKLPIRDSKVCKKCPLHTTEHLLKELAEGKIKLENYPKLEAKFGNESIIALNDLVVRNSIPIHALRFRVYINGKLLIPEVIIGDGVVFTTVFGSSGYYQSITRKTIEREFAIAFNNTTFPIENTKFSKGDIIKVEIIRGPGTLSSDNNSKLHTLKEGDHVTIHASTHDARIYVEKTLRCTECVVLRDKRLR